LYPFDDSFEKVHNSEQSIYPKIRNSDSIENVNSTNEVLNFQSTNSPSEITSINENSTIGNKCSNDSAESTELEILSSFESGIGTLTETYNSDAFVTSVTYEHSSHKTSTPDSKNDTLMKSDSILYRPRSYSESLIDKLKVQDDKRNRSGSVCIDIDAETFGGKSRSSRLESKPDLLLKALRIFRRRNSSVECNLNDVPTIV